jgi:hypothetical protein
VNIACPHAHGFVDDEIDQANNRTFIVFIVSGLRPTHFGLNGMAGCGQFGSRSVDAASNNIHFTVDKGFYFTGACQAASQFGIQTESQQIQQVQIHRVFYCYLQFAVVLAQGDNAMFFDKLFGNEF